jgi:hypothetical protein
MMNDDQKKLSTERVFQLYGEQDINLLLNISNLTELDRKIIFTDIIKDKNLFTNFKFKELEKRLRIFMDEIRSNSVKPYVIYAHIKGEKEENVLTSVSSFNYNKLNMSPIVFPYLYKSNSIYQKINYTLFNNRFSNTKSIFQEQELSTGINYSQKFSKLSYFISNLFFLKIGEQNLEFITKFQVSNADKDIKRKQNSKVFKAILSKNFNERPFIFRENYNFDHINKLNLEYSHKIISNQVDEYNCSSELLSKLPLIDSQHHLKLYYLNHISNSKNISYLKVGSSIVNSLNSLFVKSKLSYRKFFFTNPFNYQVNFELGNVTNLKGENDNLRIHEKLFVSNFRGIVNPSRKIVLEEGKTGDSLGNTNYLMLGNKIIFNNIPIFNNFSLNEDGIALHPFAHFNLLWTPEFPQNEKKTENDYNPLHLSAGFGISLTTGAFAIEVYYNAYVKKNNHDVGKEFSIKFGLD